MVDDNYEDYDTEEVEKKDINDNLSESLSNARDLISIRRHLDTKGLQQVEKEIGECLRKLADNFNTHLQSKKGARTKRSSAECNKNIEKVANRLAKIGDEMAKKYG